MTDEFLGLTDEMKAEFDTLSDVELYAVNLAFECLLVAYKTLSKYKAKMPKTLARFPDVDEDS